jgi:hypothetical protein
VIFAAIRLALFNVMQTVGKLGIENFDALSMAEARLEESDGHLTSAQSLIGNL